MGKHKSKFKQKKSKPLKEDKQDKTQNNLPIKKRYYFLLILIISVIAVSGIYTTYALTGGYIVEITRPFPLWKQYQVGFTTVNLPGSVVTHYEYLHGLGNVRGDLNMISSIFNINNEIKVKLILRPEFKESFAEKAQFMVDNSIIESSTINMTDAFVFQKLMDAFPQEFFIVFVGAENVENIGKYNDRFAIINATRNFDELQFEGSGNIVYELGGTRDILFLDPSQLAEFMKIRKEFTSDTIIFNFPTVPPPELPEITTNSTVYAFTPRQNYANLIDGTTIQKIEIESDDASSIITQKNIDSATLGLVIIPIMLPFLVILVNKIFYSKSKK